MPDAPDRCAYHHETPSVAACDACGKAICGVCRSEFNSRPYCPGCGVGRANQLPAIAGLFSLFAPGLGQVYNGQFGKAVAVFFLAPFVIPWIWGVFDAVKEATSIRSGAVEARTIPTGPLLLALKIVFIPIALFYIFLVAVIGAAIAGVVGLAAN